MAFIKFCIDSVRLRSDEKSVLEYLAIPKPDLLNFDMKGDSVFRPSYFIAIDRHTSSIILSIRGTMVRIKIGFRSSCLRHNRNTAYLLESNGYSYRSCL